MPNGLGDVWPGWETPTPPTPPAEESPSTWRWGEYMGIIDLIKAWKRVLEGSYTPTALDPRVVEVYEKHKLELPAGITFGEPTAADITKANLNILRAEQALKEIAKEDGDTELDHYETVSEGGWDYAVGYNKAGKEISGTRVSLGRTELPKEPTIYPQYGEPTVGPYGMETYFNPYTGKWETPPGFGEPPAEEQLAPGAMTDYQRAVADLAQRQFEWEQEQAGIPAPMSEWQKWQTGYLTREQQQEQRNYLAQLAAQPKSWLEYAAASGQPPVVQPWMLPLMPQEYAGLEGLRAGQPVPGWPEQFLGTNAPQYGGGYQPTPPAGIGGGGVTPTGGGYQPPVPTQAMPTPGYPTAAEMSAYPEGISVGGVFHPGGIGSVQYGEIEEKYPGAPITGARGSGRIEVAPNLFIPQEFLGGATQQGVTTPSPAPSPAPLPITAMPSPQPQEQVPPDWWLPMGNGGVVTQPTKALLGEKEDEVVIPMSQLSSWLGNYLTPSPKPLREGSTGSQQSYGGMYNPIPAMSAQTPPWMGQFPLSKMPQMVRPSRQYQARMGPTALQQYYAYRQARTGITPEESRFRLGATAPPGGRYQGLRWIR